MVLNPRGAEGQAVNCGVPEKSHRKWEEGIGNRGGGREIKWKVEIVKSGR